MRSEIGMSYRLPLIRWSGTFYTGSRQSLVCTTPDLDPTVFWFLPPQGSASDLGERHSPVSSVHHRQPVTSPLLGDAHSGVLGSQPKILSVAKCKSQTNRAGIRRVRAGATFHRSRCCWTRKGMTVWRRLLKPTTFRLWGVFEICLPETGPDSPSPP